MAQKNYKEESRKNWVKNLPDDQQLSNEDLTLGAILRIADATELMATDFIELQRQNQYLKHSKATLEASYESEKKRSAMYKGLYSKEKSKANELLTFLNIVVNMSEDKGREGCTYDDTDFDSLSAVYGHNKLLEYLKDKASVIKSKIFNKKSK